MEISSAIDIVSVKYAQEPSDYVKEFDIVLEVKGSSGLVVKGRCQVQFDDLVPGSSYISAGKWDRSSIYSLISTSSEYSSEYNKLVGQLRVLESKVKRT